MSSANPIRQTPELRLIGGGQPLEAGQPHRIALIGNPAVGKSALFDCLCGGNTPPTAHKNEIATGRLHQPPSGGVDILSRRCQSCASQCKEASDALHPTPTPSTSITELLDLPSATGIFLSGDSSALVRELLVSHALHGVILVLDAKNLRRSLALALEVAELGIPMVLDLNMIDEAQQAGVQIDDAELARAFGAPVTRTAATDGVGIRRLRELLFDAQVPSRSTRFSSTLETALGELADMLPDTPMPKRAIALLLLAGDAAAHNWIDDNLGREEAETCRAIIARAELTLGTSAKISITNSVHAEAELLVDRAVTLGERKLEPLARFGRLAQRPLVGSLIALAVVALAYLWVGVFAATWVVDAINTHLFAGLLQPALESLVAPIPSDFWRSAIADPDFGVLPTGVFLALGIVLPVLFAFYLLHGVLEDSGYLPRLAVLLDRIFRRVGLNGQALIPLVLGFSCITMAVITTRMLATNRERIILTLLLCMGIPCAPLLAVMVVILGGLPWTASLVVFGVIAAQVSVAGYAASRLLGGLPTDLVMELPTMRLPSLRRVTIKTLQRTWIFLKEAVPIFLAAAAVVFLFHWFGGLELMESVARPMTRGLLGLPDQAVQVFIKTAIRRESGAAELSHLSGSFDNVQLVVTLLVMTFLIPCINAAIVIFKERGIGTAILILGTATTWAVLLGAMLQVALRATGIVS